MDVLDNLNSPSEPVQVGPLLIQGIDGMFLLESMLMDLKHCMAKYLLVCTAFIEGSSSVIVSLFAPRLNDWAARTRMLQCTIDSFQGSVDSVIHFRRHRNGCEIDENAFRIVHLPQRRAGRPRHLQVQCA